jgi:primosomal protein N' (replication factor Y)
LLCHYCGREEQPQRDCPECLQRGMLYLGSGTERIEELLGRRFPDARLARMDSDTMRKRSSYARVLGEFRRGEIDILVGTQMIAKGLDFPNVTLVGIVKADMSLNLADFRASERTFQLVAQVAGRTGRGEQGGKVIVQTFMPEDVAIRAAAAHDYDRFAKTELEHRRTWGYPPYMRLARIILRGEDEAAVTARAEALHASVAEAWKQLRAGEHEGVLPAAPCPIPRIKGEYRFHLLVRARDAKRLADVLNGASELDRTDKHVAVQVDVDPVSML